jgi:hypothetical protein
MRLCQRIGRLEQVLNPKPQYGYDSYAKQCFISATRNAPYSIISEDQYLTATGQQFSCAWQDAFIDACSLPRGETKPREQRLAEISAYLKDHPYDRTDIKPVDLTYTKLAVST